jgi:Tol biopolymer transport system component
MDTLEHVGRALADRYRIERELGAGGMATVYLAHDVKHDRKVAIKVLKPELAAVLGAERFVVEIKTTAALQHPHILPLFDSGEAGGFLYYVMPYIQGETIREKLNRETQFGVDEAVRIAREVADALDYAHRHGVIHRDIKPENILLHDGRAMVMDFGIALAVSAAAGGRMTETGLSLGTPHYMSPEQATAEREISARSDIYSLASVLYEMLAGDPPFTASSAQAVIMKIITEPAAPVTTRRKSVPPNVAAAVAKSLEKLPADRFTSASEFALALQGQGDAALLARYGQAGAARADSPLERRARWRERAVWASAAIGVGAVAWSLATPRAAASDGHVVRFLMATPDSERPLEGPPYSAAISPDGSAVVYSVADASGAWKLYLYRTDRLDSRPIPGTERATQPIFSPDGKSIAFESGTKLRRVALDGSAAAALSSGSTNDGAVWTGNDEIVLGADAGFGGLSRVSANGGGRLVALTKPDSSKGETEHWYPVLAGDGKTIVFAVVSSAIGTTELAMTSLDDAKVTHLGVRGFRPLAVLDDVLIYVQADGMIMAVHLDVKRRHTVGTAVPVLGPVVAGAGNAEIFVSQNGGVVAARTDERRRLAWFGRDGSVSPVTRDARVYQEQRISRDGRRVAVTVLDGQSSDIWIGDLAAGGLTRLTTVQNAHFPAWSSDGTQIFFIAEGADGKSAIWSQQVDGGGAPQKTAVVTGMPYNLRAVPDGKSLVYTTWINSSYDIRAVRLDSVGTDRAVLVTPALEVVTDISPDSRWMAYYSEESGTREAYIRSYPDARTSVRVSSGGAGFAQWSADGKELYYQQGATMLMSRLAVDAAGVHVLSRDTVSKQMTLNRGLDERTGFGVSVDGKRFLGLATDHGGLQLVVSPNWITELREKLATKKK